MSMDEEYKSRLREFMAIHGRPVRFDEWGSPDFYGWSDYDAFNHGMKCDWIIPEGATLEEEYYDEFEGTFVDAAHRIGVNVGGVSCKCRKYTNKTLRYSGSFGNLLRGVLGIDGKQVTL